MAGRVPFRGWVDRGLRTLARELPSAHARLAAALGAREVRIVVDAEEAVVESDGHRVWLRDEASAPCVTLATTRREVVVLADAERSLVESVLRGDTVLRGRVADLAAFHDGLVEFLRGAVRSPSFPGLMDAFRADVVSSDPTGRPRSDE
ncbi:MAG: hypothetical protein JWM10_4917 [Myxococcaceae bacterium]|nr:hypothetical protein [Myxococcaceae bacterium]